MRKLILIIPILFLFFTACEKYQRIYPSGEITEQTRSVSDFNGLDISSGFVVELSIGDSNSVRIESQENVLAYIDTYVSGTTLFIEPKDNVNFSSGVQLKAYVTIKDLNYLHESGGSELVVLGDIETNRFDVELSGGSQLQAQVWANDMFVMLSGGSYIDLEGGLENLDIESTGGSKFYSYSMVCNYLNCNLSGGSKAEITVNEIIDVNASGGSILRYKGNGLINQVELSGESEIKHIE